MSVSNPDTQAVYSSSCFIENRKFPLCVLLLWSLESIPTHWLQDCPGQPLGMQLFQTSGYAAVSMPGFRRAGRSKNHLISGGLEDIRCPFLTSCHSSSLWMPMHVPQPSTKEKNWKWCSGVWSLLCWLLLSHSPNARAPALLPCHQLASCPQVKEPAAPSTLLLSSSPLSQSRFKQKDKFWSPY